MDKSLIRDLVVELYRSGAIALGSYRLRSGRISPYYIDLRIIISKPRLLRAAAEAMLGVIKEVSPSPTKLCGIPMAGALLVSAIAVIGGYPGIYVRKEPSIYRDILKRAESSRLSCVGELQNLLGGSKGKWHGISRLVDGIVEEGDRVLIVDDVITTGDTKLEAIEALEEDAKRRGVSIDIVGVAVLVDREEGGSEELSKKGIKLYRVLSVRDMVGILLSEGLMSESTASSIIKYLGGVASEGKA